jgi:hypothetical protein
VKIEEGSCGIDLLIGFVGMLKMVSFQVGKMTQVWHQKEENKL